MATITKFEELEVWKMARELSREIINICQTTNLKTDYRLKEQIKSSSGSVMDNIAEGFERDGNLEFRQFLSIAKGSAGETRSQLYRLFDSGYINETNLEKYTAEYEKLSKRIASFIVYLNKADYKGIKYKT